MELITRWDKFKTVSRFEMIDARCYCCRGVFTGVRLYLSQVLQKESTAIICNSCVAARSLRRRHTNPPPSSEISKLLRSILTKQWGLCAITGEPLQWGYNCSPDHIVSVGGSGSGKKSPWDAGNLQMVSIAANNFKGDLSMGQTTHLLSALRGDCDLQNPRIRSGQRGTQSAILSNHARGSSGRRSSKGRKNMVVEIDTKWVRDHWESNPVCYWSGLPFPSDDLPGMTYTVSLDRLDDRIGYTFTNTVLCLAPFNRMRANGSNYVIGSGMGPGRTQDYIHTLRSPEPIRSARFRMMQEKYPRYSVSFPDDLPF